MKRLQTISILMLLLCIIFSLSACASAGNSTEESTAGSVETTAAEEISSTAVSSSDDTAEANEEEQSVTTSAQKDVLVVFFSQTGTTKGVAEKIASITDGDIYEILAAEPYTAEDLNWNNAGTRATVEQNNPDARPKIGSEDISLDGYKTVYIGYPIWWGEAPRIMSTFVEKYDFNGITVIPFCTSGSSDIGNSGNTLSEQSGSGNWIAGRRFSGNTSEADLESWINGLQ